jgi:hypothetical protein
MGLNGFYSKVPDNSGRAGRNPGRIPELVFIQINQGGGNKQPAALDAG